MDFLKLPLVRSSYNVISIEKYIVFGEKFTIKMVIE